eukprot:9486782-Pyramimonas_sp.AAC.1
MGFRETLAHITSECAGRYGENHILNTTRSQSVKLLQMFKEMYAALRREPHFENRPPSIDETVATC